MGQHSFALALAYNWCWKIWGGEKTDRVGKKLTGCFFLPGKKLTSQFLPRGRNGPAWSFPGERLAGGGKNWLLHRGILLLLHIVGQGPAVLAAGAGRVGYIFYIFHLPSLSNVLSFGRWLNMTEILWFWLLNPNGSCQLLPRTSLLSTG